MDHKTNEEEIKLENFLKSNLAEDEVVLWQGKPDMRIFFKEEKSSLFYGPLILYFIMSTFALLMQIVMFENYFIGFKFYWIIFIFAIGHMIFWYFRKKNTLFVITNMRAIELSDEVVILEKKLNEILHYEIRRSKKGGNLQLGNKRYYDFYYDRYEQLADEKIYFKTLNQYMSHINYFCFFDLADVDTPAALIRKYAVNAVEYIDPKLKKTD